MAKKQPRKVALINVADYPRDKYSAHWQITVQGDDEEGYHWKAEIISYVPLGYEYKGQKLKEWPVGVPTMYDQMPADVPVKQPEFLRMSPDQQRQVIAEQDARRAKIAEIYRRSPKPLFVLNESLGACETRDEADTEAQEWVLKQMLKHKRPKPMIAGYVIPLPVDLLGEFLRYLGRLFLPWLLMAIAYSTTVRNNRLNQVRDAIDGGAGAGLLRIYDGSRPATCGTATTLLAELTFSDPCAPAASGGVLTMSAITADASANATGTATWFRCVDSTGTCCIDGNVGTSGSDLNMNSTSINVGVQVSVTSFTLTAGNP